MVEFPQQAKLNDGAAACTAPAEHPKRELSEVEIECQTLTLAT
jgi:hypothetical protein